VICGLLRFCPAATAVEIKKVHAALTIDKCAICEQVVTLAESALANNATEQEISNLLNQLCTLIDNSPLKQFGAVCHQIADNVPLLVQLIESEAAPDVICGLLQFCPAVSAVEIKKVHVAHTIDKCTICEQVVSIVESALANNATEQEISNVLNKLCSVLDNSPLKEAGLICHDVAANIPVLINLLEQQLPPHEVCALLKICNSTVATEGKTLSGVDSCAMCTQVISLVEFELEQGKTIDEVVILAHDLCAVVAKNPILKPLAAACNKVADSLPDLLPQLINQLTPELVCAQLGQCPVTHRMQ